jgi:glycyl-tRNA synthetase
MDKTGKEAILVSRGFLWGPSPEVYRGVSGFYDFGPMGKIVKNSVENETRKVFIGNGFFEVECPTLMPEIVWKASGHLDRFIDMITKCKKCKNVFKMEGLKKCPLCGGGLSEPEEYNLMVKTKVGMDKTMFLRPETATTTYLLFPRLFLFFRRSMPIKVFQIGKAYRNEISPRQGVIRLREFTQMESQMFIKKEQEREFPEFDKIRKEKLVLFPYSLKKQVSISLGEAVKKKYLKKPAFAWCMHVTEQVMKSLGIKDHRYRQHNPKERAHYADDAWDVEVRINNDWVEVCGVHDRTDYDLKRHSEFSKQKMEAGGEVPQVLEIAFGVERLVYAILMNSIKKDGERNLMGIHKSLAPFQVAVFPLIGGKDLETLAEKVYQQLSKDFRSFYDSSGSIGRRYRRQDEIGTPFCITIDHKSLEDGTVTIRYRDSMEQERVKIDALKVNLNEKFF